MFFTEIAITALIIYLRNHPAIIFLSFTHYQMFLMIDLFTDYYIISNNALDNVINFLYNLSCIICASRQ